MTAAGLSFAARGAPPFSALARFGSSALADELEAFADEVRRLPGLSRRDPGAFLEAKDDLAARMFARAAQLRDSLPATRYAGVCFGPSV